MGSIICKGRMMNRHSDGWMNGRTVRLNWPFPRWPNDIKKLLNWVTCWTNRGSANYLKSTNVITFIPFGESRIIESSLRSWTIFYPRRIKEDIIMPFLIAWCHTYITWDIMQEMGTGLIVGETEALIWPLQWRHNGRDGVSNHQPHYCLLSRLFRLISKKTSKLRATGLRAWNSSWPVNSPHKWPVTRKLFPFDDVIMAISPHPLICGCVWKPSLYPTPPWFSLLRLGCAVRVSGKWWAFFLNTK